MLLYGFVSFIELTQGKADKFEKIINYLKWSISSPKWYNGIGIGVQATVLIIRALLICELSYSHRQNCSKLPIFQSKMDFLSANSVFAVQNDGSYLPRITRENCIAETL